MWPCAILVFLAGCGRIAFDPVATTEDGAIPPRDVCFHPRIDMEMCTGAPCASASPISITASDFDRDGRVDLAIGDDVVGVIAVQRRTPAGFEPYAELPIMWDAQELVAVDLDQDGLVDLVAVSWNSSGVAVYYGTATGFEPEIILAGPSTPIGLAVDDVYGDGWLDIVTAGMDEEIHVFRGTSARTFTAPFTWDGQRNFYAVRIADVDGDGDRDLVATGNSETLTVLAQSPSPPTWTPRTLAVPDFTTGIADGDFDGDGDRDLVIAARSSGAFLLRSDGAGGYGTEPLPSGAVPIWPVAADLDEDGDLDLVIVAENGGRVDILVNAGDAAFSRLSYELDSSANNTSTHGLAKAVVADLDGDGDRDIAIANPAGRNVAILYSGAIDGCP